jgi:excinuclease UvrABC nuclease subunit
MPEKSYLLTFNGYWREPNISGLPASSGIYCVYGCTHNTVAGTVTLNRLLYVGEAENVNNRVRGHEKLPEWRRELRLGEQICISAALISGIADRQRAEAAQIFKHKPPCNTTYQDAFPFDRATISNIGQAALLIPKFTVDRTEALSKVYSTYGLRRI